MDYPSSGYSHVCVVLLMGRWNGAMGRGAAAKVKADKRAEAEVRALAYKASKKSIHSLSEEERALLAADTEAPVAEYKGDPEKLGRLK